MYISIIGTSSITKQHIEVLRKNFKILSISATRKNSKNLRKISKKYKINNTFYDWKKSIQFSKKIKNLSFFITSRIEDNEKILEECCKTRKKIFIEKPIFLNSFKFEKFNNFNKQIFIGYNRIFYKNIIFLKKEISDKKNLNIIVNCPESDKKSIYSNSCHIISILFFLFGKLSIKRIDKRKNNINCVIETKFKNLIFLTFNLKNSNNFSIEIYNKKLRYLLSPIENLKIYKGFENKIKNNNRIYFPKLKKNLNEFRENKFKPGFLKQSNEFKKFTRGKKIQNNVYFGKRIIKFIEKILI